MKKYLKKLLCTVFAISILLVSTINVNAATPYKVISEKTKVGNYYIWINNEKGIYVSKSQKSSPKIIVKAPKSSDTYITHRLVTDGSKIYYGVEKRANDVCSAYMKIYRIDVSGKNNVYVGKINHGESLSGYYNGNLFVETDSYYSGGYNPNQADTYIYNLSSKKLSLVKREFKIDYQNGKYILGSPYIGDVSPFPIHVYNASTKKTYQITSKGCQAKFLNGKIYYAYGDGYAWKTSDRKISIKTSSYTGKNQKTLCTIKMENCGGIVDIKSSYVEYFKHNKDMSKTNYYKYYYSSGKVVEVKK